MAVTRTERLLNLVIALLASRAPVSRAVIQSSVAGYDPHASVAAFERMFERDKDELRGMGIPIDTVTDAHGEVLGYSIDADEYALAPIDLSVEELSVVSLAARVWDEAVLGPAAVTGLRKLETLTGDIGDVTPARSFGSLAASEAAFLPLLRAVREGRVVTFDYRKPGDDVAAKRTVEPWTIRSTEGHWYLHGWDVERQEQRSFRLSRIDGKVTLTAIHNSAPVRADSLGDTTEHPDEVEAIVSIPESSGIELRRLAHAEHLGASRWRVRAQERDLVHMLLRADPGIVVEEPAEIVAQVRSTLREMIATHS